MMNQDRGNTITHAHTQEHTQQHTEGKAESSASAHHGVHHNLEHAHSRLTCTAADTFTRVESPLREGACARTCMHPRPHTGTRNACRHNTHARMLSRMQDTRTTLTPARAHTDTHSKRKQQHLQASFHILEAVLDTNAHK